MGVKRERERERDVYLLTLMWGYIICFKSLKSITESNTTLLVTGLLTMGGGATAAHPLQNLIRFLALVSKLSMD